MVGEAKASGEAVRGIATTTGAVGVLPGEAGAWAGAAGKLLGCGLSLTTPGAIVPSPLGMHAASPIKQNRHNESSCASFLK
jgi:hypothetical protein